VLVNCTHSPDEIHHIFKAVSQMIGELGVRTASCRGALRVAKAQDWA